MYTFFDWSFVIIFQLMALLLIVIAVKYSIKEWYRVTSEYETDPQPFLAGFAVLGSLLIWLTVSMVSWALTDNYRLEKYHPCVETKDQRFFHVSKPMYRQSGETSVYLGQSEEYYSVEQVCTKRKE